MEQGRSGEANS